MNLPPSSVEPSTGRAARRVLGTTLVLITTLLMRGQSSHNQFAPATASQARPDGARATPAANARASATQGWTGPQTAPLSAVGLGANGAMNGFLPFCPSPSNCSVIYKDISGDPVDTVNDAHFKAYSNYASAHLGPNFDSSAATLPWYTLDTAPGADTAIHYLPSASSSIPTESDDTVLPLKPDMRQEGDGNPNVAWTGDGRDRHLGILDKHTGKLFETYQLQTVNGKGELYSQTVWNLLQPIEQQNTQGYTSADAAGLPQVAMGVTYEDLAAGDIKHALRITVPRTSCGFYNRDTFGLYQSPASHAACGGGGPRVAFMGERLRIKASTRLPRSCGPQGTVIFNAGKKHGFIVADNGMFGLFQGTYDRRINQADVACMASITGSDLEVVDTGARVVAGELNPETMAAGASIVFDQTSLHNSTTQGPAVASGPAAPTVVSFTASASTVALGSSVVLRLTATNAVKSFVDNAYGVIDGNSGTITVNPTQTTTYTAKVRGLNGYAYSNPVTVTVTGPTAAMPTASLATGNYTSAQTVTLATATEGAAIFYTLDGSVPSTASTRYTGPLPVGTSKTVKAMATAPGRINSRVMSASYNIVVPGATPQVVGVSAAKFFADSATATQTYTFTGGTTAILMAVWANTLTRPTVACGAAKATLIPGASLVQTTTAANPYNMAVYSIPSVPGGVQTCKATYATGVYSTLYVTEVSGTSGAEAVSTGNTVTYPRLSCGSLTTKGANRLALAYGFVPYSTVTAEGGYTQLFTYTGAGIGGESTAIASASTRPVSIHAHDSSTGAVCIAVALKP